MRNFPAHVLRWGRTATRHHGSIQQTRDLRTLPRIAHPHKAACASSAFSSQADEELAHKCNRYFHKTRNGKSNDAGGTWKGPQRNKSEPDESTEMSYRVR